MADNEVATNYETPLDKLKLAEVQKNQNKNQNKNGGNNITSSTHPIYNENIQEWEKYRSAYAGGQAFIDEYTKQFSKREDNLEFKARIAATYCPAHAKVAVNEIKDAISERLIDVERIDGPATYQEAIIGLNDGVDRDNSIMNGFVSSEILPELLSMGKVGVFVDREKLDVNISKADEKDSSPYLYTYVAEDILNWVYDDNGDFVKLLLKEEIYTYDEINKLPLSTTTRYRFLQLTEKGVTVTLYDVNGIEISTETLRLKMIPFALFNLKQSLMTDIANYQIALLNLGSSDLSYAIRSNFPFYTEQFDPKTFALEAIKAGAADTGTSDEANVAKTKELLVGASQGRRYSKGLERPQFVNPSPDPLKVSMEKQEKLQIEIRELVRLNVKTLNDSNKDSLTIESGMSCIGLELEKGERQIGKIWADYTGETAPVIKYPKNYTLKTEAERRAEASELQEQVAKTPSIILQKVLTKQIATILADHRVSKEVMDKIYEEIDTAEVIITDPEVIREDHEAGLVGTELASKLRGYPVGEVPKAKEDHAERLARIAIAQSAENIATNGGLVDGARGVKDLDAEKDTAKNEKELSRNKDKDETTKDKTRGGAK